MASECGVILIFEPALARNAQVERGLDDFFEALAYWKEKGTAAQVRLSRFDKNGLPIYFNLANQKGE